MKHCKSLLLGCLGLGSRLSHSESLKFLESAVRLGIREFDTGSLYGNGQSEIILGEFARAHQLKLDIHTKIGLEESPRKDGSFGVSLSILTPEKIKNDAMRATERLRQSSIRRITLHSFCPEVPIPEQVDTLQELVRSGVIKSYGLANFTPSQLENWIGYCNVNSKLLPSDLDLHFNLLEQRVKYEIMPLINDIDVRIVPYRVFCRGVLSGRYDNSSTFPLDSRACSSWRVKQVITDENIAFVDSLREIACKHDLSLIELVLLWTFSFHSIRKICLGTCRVDQLSQIIESLEQINLNSIQHILNEIEDCELDRFKKLPSTYFET